MKMYERARLDLTLAWQEPALFEGVTVREYLTLGKPDCDPEPALKQVGLAPDRYLDRRMYRALSGEEGHRTHRERDTALSSNHNGENEVIMITSIAFTVYPVSQMERARAFYEHVLGLHESHNYQDVWVEYDLGDSTFAITTTEMGHIPGAKGAVVAFEVSDLDAFVHKMKERAVSFVMEAFDTPVCRMAVIEDQDGNHITIHKRHA